MKVSMRTYNQLGTQIHNLVIPGINPPIPPFPPFDHLPNQIIDVFRRNNRYALSATEIMVEIEGDIISPISGFIFTAVLDYLLGQNKILAKEINGVVYFVHNPGP